MNESLIILNVGYALTFIALAIREVLWLRTTLTAAQISLFTYHYFYAGNISAAFWTAIFVLVNTYNIVKILLERRQYYQGKATAAVYAEEPFPFKVRDKDDLKLYLDADEKLKNLSLKREYYDMMLRYTEEILKQISNRTYQIKNAIEWRRFTSGYG